MTLSTLEATWVAGLEGKLLEEWCMGGMRHGGVRGRAESPHAERCLQVHLGTTDEIG